MGDIFNRTITLGPVISGDLLRITFGTGQGGMIPQAVRITQRRNIGVGVDPGTGNLYQVIGIPELAVVQIRGLITTASTYKTFISTYGTGCSSASDLTITVTAPVCGSSETVTYTLKYPRLLEYGAVVGAGEGGAEGHVFISDVALAGVAIEMA